MHHRQKKKHKHKNCKIHSSTSVNFDDFYIQHSTFITNFDATIMISIDCMSVSPSVASGFALMRLMFFNKNLFSNGKRPNVDLTMRRKS